MRIIRAIFEVSVLWLSRFRGLSFGKRLAIFLSYLLVTWFIFLGIIPATLGYTRLDPYTFAHAMLPFRAVYGGNIFLAWIALFFRNKAEPKQNFIRWFFGSSPK